MGGGRADEEPLPLLTGVVELDDGLELRPWPGLGLARFTGEVEEERLDTTGPSESESSEDMVPFDKAAFVDFRRLGVFFFSICLVLDFAWTGVLATSSSSEDPRTLSCFFSFRFSGVFSLVGERC